MKLEELGYKESFEKYRAEQDLTSLEVGRVIAEHKERYKVRTTEGDIEAEITGNMRFTAQSREDFPAVGDWVALTAYDEDMSIIHHILPRFSLIKRKAVGQFGEIQIIAANIDFAFLIQAVDRDYNINRLERYLTICHESKVKPLIILTKVDLINESQVAVIKERIESRVKDVPIMAISNESLTGFEELINTFEQGKTYCMLGSSGVGKSTLLNNLSGRSVMKTGDISGSTNKGRHVTSHRELVILENGGILIDNPGMREVGITDTESALENTFNVITSLSKGCKFKDCTHTGEKGCAVMEALEKGQLDHGAYDNYLKMEREKSHFESSLAERKKKEKDFGKFLKNYKKDIRKYKPKR